MDLMKGAEGAEVKSLQRDLIKLGAKFQATGTFGDQTEKFVIQFQLNAHLQPDGVVGPETLKAISNAVKNLEKPKLTPVQTPTPAGRGKPGWVTQLESRLGWTEFSHDKQIAKDWGLTGLPQYKTVIGKKYAWCGLAQAIAMNACGIKPPRGSAGARNWSKFGERSGYICGAILSLRHASGGNHVTCFLYWIDEKKKIAACLGGNQNQKYSIAKYNISGNKYGHDEVVGGPRWPSELAQTAYTYPRGKADAAGSTR